MRLGLEAGLVPGTRLGSYEIVAPIGAGGMGEVYRAKDSKLRREVAIKVLPPSLANDLESLARFEREAFAVAALSHPNILSIFDFGNQDGIAYAVMELLEGETLRARLDAGPVPQKEALGYALQLAKGLSAAHDKGVVHRDLKPDNLWVTREGHLKILDFGLAKRVEPAAPGEETSAPTVSGHTEPGQIMGTVGYMSPEQVRGLRVDHRSDIFSFGVILYELLSGKKAFKRDTAGDTMAAILRDEPPELSGSGRNVSPALDLIVKHCMEKDRDHRVQTSRDIVFALAEQAPHGVTSGAEFALPAAGKRRIVFVAAAAVLVVVAGLLLSRRPHRGPAEAPSVKRVAVLPFENLGSPEDDYFADGIGDEVRSKLTSLPGVEVIARASSTPYKKTTKTPGQIARELDVEYLLTATVRWQKGAAASRVHVIPELIEVRKTGSAASKWQQPFDAALTDVFQVQSDIATKVAQALGGPLGTGEQKRLSEKPTQNFAAYNAFLKGEEVTNGAALEPSNRRRALGFYEQAVALDPRFALAWARVSYANSILYAGGVPTSALAERARQAAEKAVLLSPGRPEAYVAFGRYLELVSRDFTGALEQYAKGQRVAPGNAELLEGTAIAEQSLGRWEAAVEHFRQAERLDPRSISSLRLGDTLLRLRRYSEARQALDRGLAVAPASLDLIERKAMTFLGEGDLAGARAVLRDALKDVEPTALVAYVATYWDLGWVLDEQQRELVLRLTPGAFDDDLGAWSMCFVQAYSLKGDAANARAHAEEARKAFEDQLRAAPEDPQLHAELGLALAYLGRKEEAIREGERAVAMDPVSKDSLNGPYFQHQLVRIYMLVGETEKALDNLEPLLKIPYNLSPGWLRIDPDYDPLRKTPRFQKLVAQGR